MGALQRIKDGGEISNALNFVSASSTPQTNQNSIIEGVKLKIGRQLFGSIPLFHTKKGTISVLGR